MSSGVINGSSHTHTPTHTHTHTHTLTHTHTPTHIHTHSPHGQTFLPGQLTQGPNKANIVVRPRREQCTANGLASVIASTYKTEVNECMIIALYLSFQPRH